MISMYPVFSLPVMRNVNFPYLKSDRRITRFIFVSVQVAWISVKFINEIERFDFGLGAFVPETRTVTF